MTTVILTPNGTGGNTGDITGVGSLDEILCDDSNGSYDELELGEECQLFFTTTALPAGGMVKTITVMFTAALSAGGSDQAKITVVDVGVSNMAIDVATPTFTDYVCNPMPWTKPQTQAAINDIILWFRCNTAQFLSTAKIRLSEISVELVFALMPVVDVVGPTGSITTTTTPTVTWTYTPGDSGGPQTRYSLRIFNAAQYGAAGFNPETSTAFSEAVNVLSGVASAVPPDSLLPGSYRAYVKVAQSINGVSQWSAWDFVAFDMDATVAAAPTVVATADTDRARVKITVTKGVGDPVAFDLVDVESSIDGGVTWQFVRGATATVPPGNVFITYDYEIPIGAPIRYRARSTNITAGGNISGSWGTSSDVTLTTDDEWLKDLTVTSRNVAIHILELGDVSRPIAQGINQVLGRSRPVVISDVRQSRRGDIDIITLDATERAEIEALITGSAVLLLQSGTEDIGNMYVTVGDVTRSLPGHKYSTERIWTLPYIEVERPVDVGLLVVGFTFQDLLDSFADFQALVDSGLTFGDIYTET